VKSKGPSLDDRARALLERRGLARLNEFVAAGITTATISRMAKRGDIVRIGRGIYQLPDQPVDANHDLALAAKLVPGGIICLVSALAFHELTDAIPPRVWMAIGARDRKPAVARPPLQIVRFPSGMLSADVERHMIDGVAVPITTPARTVVDLFRYRARQGRRYQGSPGLALALEGLREALRTRKATPAEISRLAERDGVWKAMRPYLEALTSHA
jgi:putative AbiEi antitoxin of type IV toxin-antitoxin system